MMQNIKVMHYHPCQASCVISREHIRNILEPFISHKFAEDIQRCYYNSETSIEIATFDGFSLKNPNRNNDSSFPEEADINKIIMTIHDNNTKDVFFTLYVTGSEDKVAFVVKDGFTRSGTEFKSLFLEAMTEAIVTLLEMFLFARLSEAKHHILCLLNGERKY